MAGRGRHWSGWLVAGLILALSVAVIAGLRR